MNTFSGSIMPALPLWINSKEDRNSLRDIYGNPTTFGVQWRVDKLEAFLRWYWYHIRIIVPLDIQVMSAIRFLIIMQWRGMNYTKWTNQISHETDKYFSENYNIMFIKGSSVTIVLHKEEFKSLGMNSNPPNDSNYIWPRG